MKEQPSQIFRVAKRMAREREDISGVNCLRDSGGSLIVDEEGLKEAWKRHMERLMNEENMWDQ